MANDDDYFLALGKFIHMFSEAEAAIHYSFHCFTKIPVPIAHAVKRESKASDLISIIKSAVEINKFSPTIKVELAVLFAHYEAVSSFRNRVIHRGGHRQDDGAYLATNKSTMKTHEALETARFTVPDITAATSDLGRIVVRIYDAAGLQPPSQARTSESMTFLRSPWRYKPVALKTPNKPHPTKPPTQSHQQKPSQA